MKYFLSLLLWLASPAWAESEITMSNYGSFQQYGDIMQVILPTSAMISTFVQGDFDGSLQYTKGFATAYGVVQGMKISFDRKRPKGTSNSFPSGHTAAAFSGASFIHLRYGDAWAWPMYTLAASVGVSRIYANYHFADDVLAGASLGIMSNLLYTSPYDSAITAMPYVADETLGVALRIHLDKNDFNDAKKSRHSYRERPNEFSLFIGVSNVNEININPTGSAPHNVSQDRQHITQVRWTTPSIVNSKWLIEVNPFSSRVKTLLDDDFLFGENTYASGSELQEAIDILRVSSYWAFDLLPTKHWELALGLGVTLKRFEVRFDDPKGGNLERALDYYAYPELYGKVGLDYGGVQFFTEWMSSVIPQDENFGERLVGRVGLGYKINPLWSLSLLGTMEHTEQNMGKRTSGYETELSDRYLSLAIGYWY
jgi:hypothetical protein